MKLILTIAYFILTSAVKSQRGSFDYDKVVEILPSHRSSQTQLTWFLKSLGDSVCLMEKGLQNAYASLLYTDFNAHACLYGNSLEALNRRIAAFKTLAASVSTARETTRLDLKMEVEQRFAGFCASKQIPILSDKKSLFYCNHCMDYTGLLIRQFASLK